MFFAMGLVFFDRMAITFLFPFMVTDLDLTNFQIGILGAAVSFAWAVSGPLVGFIADKNQKRKIILILLVVVFSLISFAQGLATGFMMLLLLRLLVGLFEGPFLPIAQSVMAIESTPSRRGFNMGFMQVTSTGLFGGVLAPLVLVALANAFDWRMAFFFTLIPGLFVAILLWRFMREPQADLYLSQNNKLEEEKTDPKPLKESKVKFMDIVKNRNVLVSMVICIFALTWFNVFAVFAPTYLVEVRGTTTGAMSIIMSTAGAAAMIWGFTVPAISDKLGRKPIMTMFALISAISPLLILYFDYSFILLGLLIFLTHTGQGFHPLFMSAIPAESVPKEYIGFSIGLIMGVGEIFGGVIAPIVAGYMADTIHISAPLFICVFSALAATFFSLFIRETAPNKVKKTAPELKERPVLNE